MRHLCTYITKCSISVSIHAPTRGATGTYIVSYKVSCVSIHAPTRGATITSVNTYARTFWFQSTHPRGVRPLLVVLPGYLTRFQSTHPRGVRLSRCTVKQSLGISFNPRTHEGCDFVKLLAQCVPRCFNPRTHEGCDDNLASARNLRDVSIHAPTRGATRTCEYQLLICAVSIHAPTRGATESVVNLGTGTGVSIHAPTRGATACPNRCVYSFACFNPRTHEGCDYINDEFFCTTLVSIHAPTRGATWSILKSVSPICFNPRTHEGCDITILSTEFNVRCFNPRTHEGCDLI